MNYLISMGIAKLMTRQEQNKQKPPVNNKKIQRFEQILNIHMSVILALCSPSVKLSTYNSLREIFVNNLFDDPPERQKNNFLAQ